MRAFDDLRVCQGLCFIKHHTPSPLPGWEGEEVSFYGVAAFGGNPIKRED